MNKDVMVASFDSDVEPILPDGWKEGDDIFADAKVVGENLELDGVEDLSAPELESLLGDEPVDTPTTGADSGVEDQNAGEVDATPGADEDQVEAVRAPRILKLRVNHEDREVDFDAMSDEELIALAQQGYAFAAMRESQAKEKYRSVYQEQLDAGMTEVVARMVATHEAGKEYPLVDEEPVVESAPAPAAAQPAEERSANSRDFKQQIKQLQAVFTDVKEMPQSVMDAYMNGADLLTAYSAYRVAQREKADSEIRKENRILKQNAASAARAPVKGVSGGGDVTPKEKDPFEKGWDLGNSW